MPSPTLPDASLRLAIADAVAGKMTAEVLVEKLFREDPERVLSIYHEVAANRAGHDEGLSSYAGREERKKLRPLPSRKRIGMTMTEIAAGAGIAAATLASLMEYHGFLELVPFGGQQKRRLVTDAAFQAELGHNVTPANRIGHLEGFHRAAVFPVFYSERLSDILWCLDFEGIKGAAAALPDKRARLAWLLGHHGYLPDAEIAAITGNHRRTVIRARPRGAGRMSQGSYIGEVRPQAPTEAATTAPTEAVPLGAPTPRRATPVAPRQPAPIPSTPGQLQVSLTAHLPLSA